MLQQAALSVWASSGAKTLTDIVWCDIMSALAVLRRFATAPYKSLMLSVKEKAQTVEAFGLHAANCMPYFAHLGWPAICCPQAAGR